MGNEASIIILVILKKIRVAAAAILDFGRHFEFSTKVKVSFDKDTCYLPL